MPGIEICLNQKIAAQRAVNVDPGLIAGHVRLAEYYFDVGDGLAAPMRLLGRRIAALRLAFALRCAYP